MAVDRDPPNSRPVASRCLSGANRNGLHICIGHGRALATRPSADRREASARAFGERHRFIVGCTDSRTASNTDSRTASKHRIAGHIQAEGFGVRPTSDTADGDWAGNAGANGDTHSITKSHSFADGKTVPSQALPAAADADAVTDA
jgi:hypothetical protein